VLGLVATAEHLLDSALLLVAGYTTTNELELGLSAVYLTAGLKTGAVVSSVEISTSVGWEAEQAFG